MPPPSNRRLSGFFNGKNWLFWDVGAALFSKVTLFSLPKSVLWAPTELKF